MPFIAGAEGASGRCSIAESLKASGHDLKEETLDGESVAGSCNDITSRLPRRCNARWDGSLVCGFGYSMLAWPDSFRYRAFLGFAAALR